MHLKRLFIGLAALGLLLATGSLSAYAAPFPSLQGDVGVCDPWFPGKCVAPWPDANVPINISTATTTQLIAAPAAVGGKARSIFITSWNVVGGGTGNFTLVYGTGVNCATGQVALTGPYNWTAQAGLVDTGMIPVPAGNAVCAITSAAIQYSGRMAYIVRVPS